MQLGLQPAAECSLLQPRLPILFSLLVFLLVLLPVLPRKVGKEPIFLLLQGPLGGGRGVRTRLGFTFRLNGQAFGDKICACGLGCGRGELSEGNGRSRKGGCINCRRSAYTWCWGSLRGGRRVCTLYLLRCWPDFLLLLWAFLLLLLPFRFFICNNAPWSISKQAMRKRGDSLSALSSSSSSSIVTTPVAVTIGAFGNGVAGAPFAVPAAPLVALTWTFSPTKTGRSSSISPLVFLLGAEGCCFSTLAGAGISSGKRLFV